MEQCELMTGALLMPHSTCFSRFRRCTTAVNGGSAWLRWCCNGPQTHLLMYACLLAWARLLLQLQQLMRRLRTHDLLPPVRTHEQLDAASSAQMQPQLSSPVLPTVPVGKLLVTNSLSPIGP